MRELYGALHMKSLFKKILPRAQQGILLVLGDCPPESIHQGSSLALDKVVVQVFGLLGCLEHHLGVCRVLG